MKTDPTFWIAARSSGLTAYLLLTCSVLAGLVLKSRPFGSRVKAATVTDLHRFLALLALVAVALHGAALVLDTTTRIDVLALVVPGRMAYRPLWTGVGIVAGELMLVIYLSFALRKRIGVRNWRRLHWLTYAVFFGTTAHGLLAGSDSGAQWSQAVYVAALSTVVLASAWRALVPPQKATRARGREPITPAP